MVLSKVISLLELYLCSSLFDSLLQVLSLFLGETLLDGSRCTVNEILSLFQTKTTSFLHGLNNLELSSTNLSEDYVERRLLLSSSGSAGSSRTSSNSNSCSGGLDTILVLQDCFQLLNFFN